MPATTYAANAVLNLLLRGVALAPPAQVYMSLHTADPGLTGASEVTAAAWPAYARQMAAQGGTVDTGFAAAASKQTQNAKLMTFGDNNGNNPVVVTHFAIWDAAAGGNCIFTGQLDDPKTYLPSDEAVIRANAMTITVV